MEAVAGFGDRLAHAVQSRGNPVVVGLDPRLEQLPGPLKQGALPGDPAEIALGYRLFCHGVIDAVAGLVPAVKPQSAFFEQLGPTGMSALHDVICYARKAGLLVILDAKRHDIGSTAEAYADGFLGEASPWQADALTVGPYLGADSLEPFTKVAHARGAGLFVLVKTSNPGGGQFQDLECQGRSVYRRVAEHVAALASERVGASGYGAVGAVVGATYPQQLEELRAAMPAAWILVPGFGSQGGTAQDVAPAFDERGLGAVINNSRGIIFAHARREYAALGEARWQDAVAAATRDMIHQLRTETRAGRLGESPRG